MCLIHFQFTDHPKYKLIVIANRDEQYQRPTEQAHFWPDAPTLLAGRDLRQKGTWLGITETGRFAALTNIRDLSLEGADKKSRGNIVKDFLTSDEEPRLFLEKISKERHAYAGFNLIAGSSEQLFHYNNAENSINEITTGTHSLSNASLNTPWPKTVRGRSELEKYLKKHETIEVNSLFAIMENEKIYPDHKLPNTGVGLEFERILSSSFIKSDSYGTRSSTVLAIDNDNNVTYHERTYNKGSFHSEKQFNFSISQRSSEIRK